MQFGGVRYYTGIVDLALTSASKRDPQGLALHFYHNGERQEDLQGMQSNLALDGAARRGSSSYWN